MQKKRWLDFVTIHPEAAVYKSIYLIIYFCPKFLFGPFIYYLKKKLLVPPPNNTIGHTTVMYDCARTKTSRGQIWPHNQAVNRPSQQKNPQVKFSYGVPRHGGLSMDWAMQP